MSVLEKELEVSDLNFDFNKKDAVTELIKEFGQQFSISKSVGNNTLTRLQYIPHSYLTELFLQKTK